MESKQRRKSEKDQKFEDVPNFRREFINSNVQYVSDTDNTSDITVNPWGIVVDHDKKETYWVANNGSRTLAKYSSKGRLLFSVNTTGAPTGIVLNECNKFRGYEVITVTEQGTIEGFNKEQNANSTTVIVDNSGTGESVYKGIAITKKRLYAANFVTGYVEMYDSDFNFINRFTDVALLKSGYAPFNVAVNRKYLYVAFAKTELESTDEEAGAGFGYIDIFSRVGELLFRLVNRGPLNAPWGMLFRDNQIYVGNFGDGRINVFDICSGEWIKAITDCHCNILSVDGLWGIENIECGDIVFAAGIDDETNGVIGKFKQLNY